jgi:hypothetical protein
MYLDLALSNAIDDVGATAEYLAQELGADKPQFKGDQLMADFGRISKFKTAVEIGKLLGLGDAEMELVMREEVARLWHDPRRVASPQDRKEQPLALSLPDEVVNILRGLSRVAKGASNAKDRSK